MKDLSAARDNPCAELARALISALGLPQNVTKLTLTMAAGKPVLVECECIPEIEPGDIGSIAAMGGRFELKPVEEGAAGIRTGD